MNKQSVLSILLIVSAIIFCVAINSHAVESSHLDSVIAYPNPFIPSDGHTAITFDYLTAGTVHIRIYKTTGKVVYDKNILTANGTVIWSAVNNNNLDLASGVYLYLITNDNGNKTIGKIIIIR